MRPNGKGSMKTLLLILTLFLTSIAYSEEQRTYNFWWEQIPAVCSTSSEIERWARDHEFTPVNASYGRSGGKPDGDIVYMVMYWINDKGETFASVTTPDNPNQVCIVFRTFDLTMNSNLKGSSL